MKVLLLVLGILGTIAVGLAGQAIYDYFLKENMPEPVKFGGPSQKENLPRVWAKDLPQPQKRGGVWEVFPVTGIDRNNLYAAFLIYALEKSFYWSTGKSDELQRNKKAVPWNEFSAYLKLQLASSIAVGERSYMPIDVPDIIAVGTASQEGDRRDEEVARAKGRAIALASEVRKVVNYKGKLWTLNMGQYALASNPKNWVEQRPVLIVLVLEKDSGINLGQALADAMVRQSSLIHPDHYNTWQLSAF